MASELPSDYKRLPKWVPVRGPLLGIFVLFVVSALILPRYLGEFDKETAFIIVQAEIILTSVVGGGIGGVIQLTRQGRTADILRFFRFLFNFALRCFLMFTLPVCLVFWVGQKYLGPWRWVAYVGTAALVGYLVVLAERWSLRKNSSTPPPEPPST